MELNHIACGYNGQRKRLAELTAFTQPWIKLGTVRLVFHPQSSASFRSSLTSWGDCHAHGVARILWHIIHLAAHHAPVAVGSCTHCRPATLQSRIAICVDLHLCRRCHCLLKLQRGRHEELLVFIVSFGKRLSVSERQRLCLGRHSHSTVNRKGRRPMIVCAYKRLKKIV